MSNENSGFNCIRSVIFVLLILISGFCLGLGIRHEIHLVKQNMHNFDTYVMNNEYAKAKELVNKMKFYEKKKGVNYLLNKAMTIGSTTFDNEKSLKKCLRNSTDFIGFLNSINWINMNQKYVEKIYNNLPDLKEALNDALKYDFNSSASEITNSYKDYLKNEISLYADVNLSSYPYELYEGDCFNYILAYRNQLSKDKNLMQYITEASNRIDNIENSRLIYINEVQDYVSGNYGKVIETCLGIHYDDMDELYKNKTNYLILYSILSQGNSYSDEKYIKMVEKINNLQNTYTDYDVSDLKANYFNELLNLLDEYIQNDNLDLDSSIIPALFNIYPDNSDLDTIKVKLVTLLEYTYTTEGKEAFIKECLIYMKENQKNAYKEIVDKLVSDMKLSETDNIEKSYSIGKNLIKYFVNDNLLVNAAQEICNNIMENEILVFSDKYFEQKYDELFAQIDKDIEIFKDNCDFIAVLKENKHAYKKELIKKVKNIVQSYDAEQYSSGIIINDVLKKYYAEDKNIEAYGIQLLNEPWKNAYLDILNSSEKSVEASIYDIEENIPVLIVKQNSNIKIYYFEYGNINCMASFKGVKFNSSYDAKGWPVGALFYNSTYNSFMASEINADYTAENGYIISYKISIININQQWSSDTIYRIDWTGRSVDAWLLGDVPLADITIINTTDVMEDGTDYSVEDKYNTLFESADVITFDEISKCVNLLDNY